MSWQRRQDTLEEQITPLPGERRNGERFVSPPPCHQRLHHGQQARLGAQQIDLVQHTQARCSACRQPVRHLAVARSDAPLSVDDQQHQIHTAHGLSGGAHHGAIHGVARLVQSGCVNQDDLSASGNGAHTLDAPPRGLSHLGDGSKLHADQPIEQCRLSDIGPTQERDEPRALGGRGAAGAARHGPAGVSPRSSVRRMRTLCTRR